jgi:beta-lactamase class A
MIRHSWAIAPLLLLLSGAAELRADSDSAAQLAERLQAIDDEMPGQLGVHVRHLGDGWTVDHHADRDWYLASTIKIPLGIVLLQKAEAGEWAMDDQLTLAETDYVDGSGTLLWEEPGERFSLAELNRRSIRESDSTATDMLIRHIGEERFNQVLAELPGGKGFGPITTILQVRHDAWSEVHPSARDLSNMDFIALGTERDASLRHGMVMEKLGIDSDQVEARSTREAFQRFYKQGRNAGSLLEFGRLLEAMVRGELLDQANTADLIELMESVNTGDRRIKAGLPDGARFAHKTGTQIDRACDIGVINAGNPDQAIVLLACAEDYQQLAQAERAFAAVGRAVADKADLR